jgi:hypothetical protein
LLIIVDESFQFNDTNTPHDLQHDCGTEHQDDFNRSKISVPSEFILKNGIPFF